MKVAHFAIFAPHGAGLYETTKDLILAERSVGIDAQFIDYGHKGEMVCREGLKDGEITTVPMSWAQIADVVVSHSVVPEEVIKSKPVIMALHGRPESSFRIEFNGGSPVLSTIRDRSARKKYKAFITFWKEHVFPWSRILPGEKIHYIPAPVDFTVYTPKGKKHQFSTNGTPNIVIADMWRDDTVPFNLILAAQYFKEHYCPETKLHIYGLEKKPVMDFLSSFKKLGLCGELCSFVTNLPEIYRAADMVITPNIIATRIVREALASGVAIVSPAGCKYTIFQADPRDYKAFAGEMDKCWKAKVDSKELRDYAFGEFNPTIVGEAMKTLCESVVEKKVLTKSEIVSIGKRYCDAINEFEHSLLRTKRRNERPIEIGFVFKHLVEMYPSTVLDVGSGITALPNLISQGGFEVDALDKEFGESNRHFLVEKDDILNPKTKKHYDFISCVSVLEHIEEHELAVRNMIKLLNPGGKLVITVPYNELEYVHNVYKLSGSGYGQANDYICQVFSRKELESWGVKVIEQEYWRLFHGKFWTFGRQYYPPIKTTKDELHQLTCLLLEAM